MRVALLVLLLLGACAHAPRPAPSSDEAGARVRALQRTGLALAEQGDLTRAEQYLVTAHREGGRDRASLIALLGVCVRASRLRSALAYAEPYLRDHPREVELLQLVAAMHLGLRELPLARARLEQVLRVEPARPEAHYLLGRVHLALGARGAPGADHARRAQRHYARYLALAPRGSHADEARAALGLRPGRAAARQADAS